MLLIFCLMSLIPTLIILKCTVKDKIDIKVDNIPKTNNPVILLFTSRTDLRPLIIEKLIAICNGAVKSIEIDVFIFTSFAE